MKLGFKRTMWTVVTSLLMLLQFLLTQLLNGVSIYGLDAAAEHEPLRSSLRRCF